MKTAALSLALALALVVAWAMVFAKPSKSGQGGHDQPRGAALGDRSLGGRERARLLKGPSHYWLLERRYVAQQHAMGRLGAEVRRLRHQGAVRTLQARASTEATIRLVFAGHGDEAVRVSSCETGGTFSTTATNGQYLGLFQMGDYARSAFGHGPTVLEQALAAYRYFVASGYSWGPWECKP